MRPLSLSYRAHGGNHSLVGRHTRATSGPWPSPTSEVDDEGCKCAFVHTHLWQGVLELGSNTQQFSHVHIFDVDDDNFLAVLCVLNPLPVDVLWYKVEGGNSNLIKVIRSLGGVSNETAAELVAFSSFRRSKRVSLIAFFMTS